MLNNLPKCSDVRGGCIACRGNHTCICLSDTDFNGKPCPFYKDMSKMSMEEIRRYEKKFCPNLNKRDRDYI
jgi:hypothetical protein